MQSKKSLNQSWKTMTQMISQIFKNSVQIDFRFRFNLGAQSYADFEIRSKNFVKTFRHKTFLSVAE